MSMQPERSCIKLEDSTTKKAHFVLLSKYGGASGQEASVDLVVTDGFDAFTVLGLAAEGLKGQAPHKMAHFIAALSDLEAARLEYEREFTERDGGLMVRVSWRATPGGPRILVSASLARAPHAGPVLAGMLDMLVANVAALRRVSEDFRDQVEQYGKQLQLKDHLVEDYVNKREEHNREMNVKVAALLNSKKQKLREMQRQLDELEEENRRLRAGGGAAGRQDTEPMDADAHDSGEEGGSAHRAGRDAQHYEHEEEEEDDDDDEGDEGQGPSMSPRRYSDG